VSTAIDPAALLAQARSDRELAYRLRGLSAVIALPFLDPPLDVTIEAGRVTAVAPSTGNAALRFDGPADFFDGFLGPDRRPGYESLTAGLSSGVHMAGADEATVFSYQGGFAQLLEVVRETLRGPQDVPLEGGYPFRDSDDPVGRYKYVTVDGVEARIYYEEAGTGDIALLMQHTAGGDGRQYRHILADPEMQKRFRLIAYDLPYHGRSLPPLGVRWWEEDYRPTKEYLMNWVVALSAALGLDRPVFMGCSVGGNLALDLAAHHKDKFRAFISLNGWYSTAGFAGFTNDPFRDPRLHPDRFAALCLGATSPHAPEPFRQEIYWNYRSNAPGVYAGDNDYFIGGHDLREDGHLIDTDLTPVYLLAGEYDSTARSEENGGPAAARNIPGLRYRVMPGLSHFAPTDDPMGFRKELLPVLDEILERERSVAA